MRTIKPCHLLCAGGLLLATVAVPAQARQSLDEHINAFWSPDYLGPFECQLGILNNSPLGLPRCMQVSNIQYHLGMFYAIAEANEGNRAAGLPGYRASIDYIQQTLESAGYEVTLQPFPFTAFYPVAEGELQSVAPQMEDYLWNEDFTYVSQTDGGDVAGPVYAVDLQPGLGNTSTSGCEASDFAGFPAGAIALVQRGTCTFGEKAANAAEAGAAGVLIFNQGDTEDRTGLENVTLGEDYSGGIPVFFATYDLGLALASQAGAEVRMVANVVREQTETWNLLAETRRGRDDNVIMVGAHLDSVFEGAGINDNGSGSAAVLELALQMAKARPRNKVRFAWWGAEEAGLVGSTYYVQNLTEEEKNRIAVYLNFDMIGSPNYAYFIYDGDGSDFDLAGPPGSAATEALFEEYFWLRGLPSEGTEISFRSDYAQFFEEGIPFGGLFTGAEVEKTEAQAEQYGGEAGIPFDPCYHEPCDTLINVDEQALEINADAMAYVTSTLARSTRRLEKEEPPAEPQMLRSVQFEKTHWGKYWIR